MSKNSILDQLGVTRHEGFKNNTEYHVIVMRDAGVSAESPEGPCKSYFAEPENASAANVSFTQDSYFGKKRFVLSIRDNLDKPFELDSNSTSDDRNWGKNRVAFAISGIYTDNSDQMKVSQIIMPNIDNFNIVLKPGKVEVTPENLALGLRFAALCADAVYTNTEIRLGELMQKAKNQNQAAVKEPASTRNL